MHSADTLLREIHELGPDTGEWLVLERQVPAFAHTHTRVTGYTDAGAGYQFVRQDPQFSQLLACTGGEGRVLIDGIWKPCLPGFTYVTAPHALCAYHVRPGRRWRVCWVIYETSQSLPGIEAGQAPRLLRSDTQQLHRVIESLCHEARSDQDPASVELWAALLHRQVMRLLQPQGGDTRLAQLWSTVARDLGGDWSLLRMTRCAGLGEESLRRLCQREFGRPPLAHLTHLRMQLAADLLSCTQEKIVSIAARVGYTDPFAFSTAFRRELGKAPSHHRQHGSP